MTEATSLPLVPAEAPQRRAVVWLGPCLVAAIVLLGAVNRWLRPVEIGSLVDSGLLGLLFLIALLALLALVVESLSGDDRLSFWRRSLGASGAGLLGGVLLVGAWGKILDPASFATTITSEGLDFLLPASVVATIALGLEVGLGFGLVAGLRSRWLLAVSAALVAFFLGLTGRAYAKFLDGIVPEDASCGCFGNLIERTPAQAFWQDFVLLVPTLALACLAVWRPPLPRLRLAGVLLLGIASLVFAGAAPSLPLDDLATRLKPGTTISDVCTGADDARVCLSVLTPELLEGEHWVIITELDDQAFVESVPELNASLQSGAGPGISVLTSAVAEEIQTFFWTRGPSFAITEAPAPMLRPLYRTLPRSFRLVDGVVVETANGLPELSGD